ncbi:outer membrane protein, partial [Asticcacaulis taihuensis]
MKHILLASAALAAMAVAGSASAEQANGWYAAADLGYNWKSDYKARSQGAMPDGGAYVYDVATDDDWAGFARLGYRYSPNWRVEFEGGYRPGDISSAVGFPRTYPGSAALVDTAICTTGVIRAAGDPCGSPKGSFEQTTVMVNLYYDFLPESQFHPFVGAGVGLDSVKAKMLGQLSTSPSGPGGGVSDLSMVGKDTVGAYQLLAGVAWALSDRLSLDVTYRYLDAGKAKFNAGIEPNGGWQDPETFTGKFSDQTLTVGLRWAFGV